MECLAFISLFRQVQQKGRLMEIWGDTTIPGIIFNCINVVWYFYELKYVINNYLSVFFQIILYIPTKLNTLSFLFLPCILLSCSNILYSTHFSQIDTKHKISKIAEKDSFVTRKLSFHRLEKPEFCINSCVTRLVRNPHCGIVISTELLVVLLQKGIYFNYKELTELLKFASFSHDFNDLRSR